MFDQPSVKSKIIINENESGWEKYQLDWELAVENH